MQDIFPQTQRRVAEWAQSPDVLGVLLVGSRSRGHADGLSDDDLEVLLTDEAGAQIAPAACVDLGFIEEGDTRKLAWDAQLTTLSSIRSKAASPHDLDHWPYERARVLFSRDDRVAEAVAAAGRMDPEFRRLRLLHATIDAWTAPRRAAKTLRRDQRAAGRLLIARGAKALARVLFALEWRWAPLDHWFEAELPTLADPERVGPDIVAALVNADPAPLEAALARLEDRLFDEGVPRVAGRRDLFFELIHPARAAERSIHGLF